MDESKKWLIFRIIAYGGFFLSVVTYGTLRCKSPLRLWLLVFFLKLMAIDVCIFLIKNAGILYKAISWATLIFVSVFGLIWNLIGSLWLIRELRVGKACWTGFNLFLFACIQVGVYLLYFFVLEVVIRTKDLEDGLLRRIIWRITNDLKPRHGNYYREPLYPRTSGAGSERSSDVPLVIAEAHPPMFAENIKVCDLCHVNIEEEPIHKSNFCPHAYHNSCLKKANLEEEDCAFCKRPFPQVEKKEKDIQETKIEK